jgi:hypothetical protein
MSELVKIDLSEYTLEPSKAQQIKATFEPMVAMLETFEEKYAEIITASREAITPELSAKAKRLRLDIGKVRIDAEKARKSIKEEYLRAGQAIDGANNILKWAVTDREEKLEAIEKHAERIEKERLGALQRERVELLSPYVADATERDLSGMDEDVWSAYLKTKKQAWEDEQEAIRKAEQERIEREKAEAEERERVRLENEKLRKEAEERERQMAEERERLQAEIQAQKDAEAKRIRDEEERKQAEERARIEAERQAKVEAEKLAKAPIKKQLHAWVSSFEIPTSPTHDTARIIADKFEAFKSWATTEIDKL